MEDMIFVLENCKQIIPAGSDEFLGDSDKIMCHTIKKFRKKFLMIVIKKIKVKYRCFCF